MKSRGDLNTEQQNTQSLNIDSVSVEKVLQTINQEDQTVAQAVKKAIPEIESVVHLTTGSMREGGRVFYIGAGTSGRLGVLDASEIPPTYSAPEKWFIGIIAGGDRALRKSIEGAEDQPESAVKDLDPFGINDKDVVIGISCSGAAAYVVSALEYARKPYSRYCQRYGTPVKEIVLVGMNPGPWGMAQTGIPFGEITAVKEWMKIEAPVNQPADMHPRRPVMGFGCKRSEVSGKRLWGWAQATFKTPEHFFSRFFVANYCPLQFIESSGRNRTPNLLPRDEKTVLLAACDHALRRTIEYLKPSYVIGVGKFAQERAQAAISDPAITIGGITHPSPANPKANSGWEALIRKDFQALGIKLF